MQRDGKGFEHIYFMDTHQEPSSVRIGFSAGRDPGRRTTEHKHNGMTLAAVMPGSKDTEGRLHSTFQALCRLVGHDKSTYVGPEVHEYVSNLLARGYAATTLADAAHLTAAPWESIDPARICSAPEGIDIRGQVLLWGEPPPERKLHVASVGYHHSECDEWFTPEQIIESARTVLGGIDTDPASCPAANKIVKAKVFWSQKQNGLDLTHPWIGSVWMNPPYGGMAQAFIERLMGELDRGSVTAAIVLLNLNAMSSRWFQPVSRRASALMVTDGRLRFMPGSEGQAFSSPSTGSVISYFGPDVERFCSEFQRHGQVMIPWKSEAA
jgi:hypothetical protein